MKSAERPEKAPEVPGARLESSDEAIQLGDGIKDFIRKWGTGEGSIRDELDFLRNQEGEAEMRGTLAALIAGMGAIAAIYGVPEEMRQYMDGNTYDIADIEAHLLGPAAAMIGLESAWRYFKEALDKREKIKRLFEST